MKRLPIIAAATLVAAALTGCCADGKCFKDPPCRPCENPCCLTDLQKSALKASTHALSSGPIAYVYGEKTYVLFSEKGQKDFEKDPAAFEEKGAVRLIRGGKVWRVDVDPGADYDLAGAAAGARPYVKPAN
jgi:hypothetical protein